MLIRCLKDESVLELDDASRLKFSAVDAAWPDSQVWYLKYKNDFSNPSFMIISKRNGQALQDVGMNVQSKRMDSTNEDQQWRRDALFIVSQMKHALGEKVMASGEDQMLVLKSRDSDNSRYFEFQHFAAQFYL